MLLLLDLLDLLGRVDLRRPTTKQLTNNVSGSHLTADLLEALDQFVAKALHRGGRSVRGGNDMREPAHQKPIMEQASGEDAGLTSRFFLDDAKLGPHPERAADLAEAVRTAVINKRAGGMGLISGRKAFQRPMKEGVGILNAIQDVYLSKQVTIA